MMKEIVAVYPGTFDPLTKGHEDLIRRASQLWPKVIVGVAIAHHKKTLFTSDERKAMASEVLASYKNVEVKEFSGLLQYFVQDNHASVIVRGLRAMSDFDYEFQMAGMNRHLMPEIETVFLTPGQQYHFVSGTFVREIALLGGDVSSFVAPCVERRLKERSKTRMNIAQPQ